MRCLGRFYVYRVKDGRGGLPQISMGIPECLVTARVHMYWNESRTIYGVKSNCTLYHILIEVCKLFTLRSSLFTPGLGVLVAAGAPLDPSAYVDFRAEQ